MRKEWYEIYFQEFQQSLQDSKAPEMVMSVEQETEKASFFQSDSDHGVYDEVWTF